MKQELLAKCEAVLQDSAKCNDENCAYILRNHCMGMLQLGIELEIISEDDMNRLMEQYPC